MHKLYFLISLMLASAAAPEVIPQAPDYTDKTMWITSDSDPDDTGADVFYIVSTWEVDWTDGEGNTIHYADVWNPEHVLVVSGYSASEYPPFADFINVGDIHSCEPWLYSDCIRRNIQARTQSFSSSIE